LCGHNGRISRDSRSGGLCSGPIGGAIHYFQFMEKLTKDQQLAMTPAEQGGRK